MPTGRSGAPCGRTDSSPIAPAAAVSGPIEEAMTTRLDVSVLICTRDRSALLDGCPARERRGHGHDSPESARWRSGRLRPGAGRPAPLVANGDEEPTPVTG